jgi:TolB-like protein/class 3 adenylate cyclase
LTGERVERRLAAVLAADVAGYSRLMGADEIGTLAALKTARREIVDPAIAEHKGRIVKTTGDGMLVEFASAVDAVACAVAVQNKMAERNAVAAQKVTFRIGINVGDIIIDGDDIFGDGVNVAARVEGECEAGGVCLSDDAFRQIRGKTAFSFDDLGEKSLKNIDRPVRLYAIRVGGQRETTFASASGSPDERHKFPPLPDKPSIAVLPFHNMSGDPEQEYFADGIVEDIITALSRFKLIFVIARNSSFTYKGKAVDVKQVGRELGVRYVLEGSVRRAGNKVRITGQLIEASTGMHLWADHFDGPLEDIFDLQDRVTASVVSAIAPKVQQAELERSKRKPTESLQAYDFHLRGIVLYPHRTRESTEEALRFFSKAIELDADFAAPYAAAARCYSARKLFNWMAEPVNEVAEAMRLVETSLKLAPDDAFVLGLAGFQTFYLTGDLDGGLELIKRARALNPNLAILWGGSGFIEICLGNLEVGVEQTEHAMRLSPLDPSMSLWEHGIAMAHFLAGRDRETAFWATKSLRDMGQDTPNTLALLAASNAFLGNTEEAGKAIARLRRVKPDWRVSYLPDLNVIRRLEHRERFVEGLRKAGLPE